MKSLGVTILILLVFAGNSFCQSSGVKEMYRQAYSFYQQGEKEKALTQFEKIYAADSTESDALVAISIIYGEQKAYQKAVVGFEKLCKLFPDKADYFSVTCYYYCLLNQPEKSRVFGRKAVDQAPYQYNGMLNLGHTYLLQQKPQEAAYWYIKAMQWITTKEKFEQAFMGDFDEIESRQLVPKALIGQFRTGLQNEFAALPLQSKATVALDSALSYQNKNVTNADKEKLLAWKTNFIEEEANATVKRFDVIAAFVVDIGMKEYSNRNRAIALGYYFSKAQNIFQMLGDSLSEARLLCQIAYETLLYHRIENKYGINKDVLAFAEEGRQLVEKYQLDELEAMSLHILSEAQFQNNNNQQGLKSLHQLYQWSSNHNDGKGYFWATNGLTIYYGGKQQTDSAMYYHRQCVARLEDAGLTAEAKTQVQLNGFSILMEAGRYRQVIASSAGLRKKLATHNDAAYSDLCEIIGDCFIELNNADSAYHFYKSAVTSFIQNSKTAENNHPTILPVQVTEKRLPSLWSLCSIAAKRKDAADFFHWSEMIKDNNLRYLLSYQWQPEYVTKLTQARADLPKDAAAIFFMGTALNQSPAMAFNNNGEVIHWIDNDNALVQIRQQKLERTLSKFFSTTNKKSPTLLDSIHAAKSIPVMQYYYLSNINPSATRSSITIKRPGMLNSAEMEEERIKLSKWLYSVYIKPFETIIRGKKTLYISADLMQHFIPFETLMMEDGRYLAEQYDIIYVPSFTIHEYLAKRQYNTGSSMIAVGNPDYSTYHPEKLQGRAFDFSILGIKSWTELPGTGQELKMLQQQFDSVQLYTGNKLSESGLKKLSSEGQLSHAAILHFALHGLAGTTSAMEDNSLVITEPDNGTEDGLLQFQEAFELDMKPQLVCLSACETGMGMIASDGSIGTMATAFLAGGAKAVLATNWTIDDEGTALFMKEVYNQVRTKSVSFAAAVANTKRKFISGAFGKVYQNPYYWAPFKYYGN